MVEKIVVGQFSTNSFLYSIWKKECLIIDPGADTEMIISHMTMKNMKPRGIVLTHGHLDHILAAGEIQDHFREKELIVPIAVHKEDSKYIGPSSVKYHDETLAMLDKESAITYSNILLNIPEADVLLEDGDKVFESDLTVLHTPGHTEGSICLYSEATETLFSGDTLFFEGIGRTDMKGGSNDDILASIKEKIFTLPVTTRVFPGHGPITTLEREVNHNPFFK